jgi:hypothetical protein
MAFMPIKPTPTIPILTIDKSLSESALRLTLAMKSWSAVPALEPV